MPSPLRVLVSDIELETSLFSSFPVGVTNIEASVHLTGFASVYHPLLNIRQHNTFGMAANTNTTSDPDGTARPEGASPSENTSRAAPQPLPTLEEIHRAIPPTGIKISDFTALFEARMPAEESFRTLLLLASAVARFDCNEMIMWPKSRPTKEEIRAAIKDNGIRFEESMELFGWNGLSEEKRELISYCLDQIAMPDMATRTIRLRGSLTAEEMIAAIPDEGITKSGLELKIKELRNPTPEEFWKAMKILSEVAV